MNLPAKIKDEIFGTLRLVDSAIYFSKISWNGDFHIHAFIHIESLNYLENIESAKKSLLAIRDKENEIFKQGVNRVSLGDYSDNFLYSAHERSIEIYPNGSGTLVYTVMMIGTLIIEFTPDCHFGNAEVVPG